MSDDPGSDANCNLPPREINRSTTSTVTFEDSDNDNNNDPRTQNVGDDLEQETFKNCCRISLKQQQQQQQQNQHQKRRSLEKDDGSGGNFAVQSIRRGSQDWRSLVQPFCADLAYCCVQEDHRKFQQQPLVRPYMCLAAVLFVDISGYSKIAAALARSGGAHALSAAVNGYLSRLLRLIQIHGGDVVKFSGDAVLCIWHGSSSSNKSFEKHVLAAASCAMQLQRQAGTHVVETAPQHVFSIHIGLNAES